MAHTPYDPAPLGWANTLRVVALGLPPEGSLHDLILSAADAFEKLEPAPVSRYQGASGATDWEYPPVPVGRLAAVLAERETLKRVGRPCRREGAAIADAARQLAAGAGEDTGDDDEASFWERPVEFDVPRGVFHVIMDRRRRITLPIAFLSLSKEERIVTMEARREALYAEQRHAAERERAHADAAREAREARELTEFTRSAKKYPKE